MSDAFAVRRLGPGDVALMDALLTMFGEVFEEIDTYCRSRPSATYLARLLGSEAFIALAAVKDGTVIGGLAAFELPKFEQERSEVYIYDIAVASAHRRQGVATALIEQVKVIGKARGAWVVFIQAEQDNAPAIALYSKLRTREDAAHFDIAVPPS
jgi:aminoglycoside 3-N-acetyltransferase I